MAGVRRTGRNEDYLEAIYKIVQKKGYAQVKDIAKVLNIGPSSVTEMMNKLSAEELINYRKYGAVTLTRKGERIGKRTWSKHVVLRDFLMKLDIPEDLADDEACMIEHIISDETLEKLTKFLEFSNMEEDPSWLDHFRHYCNTGEYIRCTPGSRDTCPLHKLKND